MTPSTCSKCGSPLSYSPGAGSGRLCLRCLLGFGLKEGGVADSGEPDWPDEADAELAALSQTFDRYFLIEKLGEGGCGVVYRAEQQEPVRREVAIKIIKLGMDSRNVIARFEAEKQALALMDHPGIARVFDGGVTTAGRPFFVMELVPGQPLTDYCQSHRLSLQQRLGLFIELCQAVQHAHQKGIIHRDLKPSNVLVVEQDGAPHPKVIDFGVARAISRQRLADDTIYTAFDQFVGTPAYMSPEQAGLTGEDVDTRTDIYSLGVLLYELLTGAPPFDPERLRSAALHEVCRIIREEEPLRPSTRRRRREEADAHHLRHADLKPDSASSRWRLPISTDLDWIVMRALDKDRSRRYETASALGLDIQHHLAQEPVSARPPSRVYRFQKFARRNKLAFGGGILLIATLIAGFGFSTWRFLKEKEARRLAAAAEAKAKAQATRSDQVARLLKDMLAAAGPSVAAGRDTALLREILGKTADRVTRELTNDPMVEVELLETVGRAYSDLEQLDKAEVIHRQTLELREKLYGPKSLEVTASLLDLGVLLNTRGLARDLVEAEGLLRRALGIRRNLLPGASLEVADALHLLGWNLWEQAKRIEAEKLQREALAIRTGQLGADDPVLIPSLESLAWLLSSDPGRLAEAEGYIRKSLAIQDRRPNPENPARINSLNLLANILRASGRPAEAETAIREAIAMRTKIFGGEHELLSGELCQLAAALADEGQLDEAEQAIRKAIAITRKARGDEHPSLALYLSRTLARILKDQRKFAEAEAVCREWVRLSKKVAPEQREVLVDALFWLGTTLRTQGKWSEVESILRESFEVCEQLREPGSTRCTQIWGMLGEALVHLGRHEEAEPLLLSSYEGLKGNSGKWETIDCQNAIRNLATVYEKTGRSAEATKWRGRLAESKGQ